MESLKHLNLSYNKITVLPITLGCLKDSLSSLQIQGNVITNLPPDVIGQETDGTSEPPPCSTPSRMERGIFHERQPRVVYQLGTIFFSPMNQ